jgi:predicted nucleic acid-binding Zn ribbon protein
MDNIKDIVNDVIGKISKEKPGAGDKLQRIWHNLLGKKELQHTNLVGVKDGQLSVYVDSSAWLYQMNIRKHKILERLQEEIPDIKGIRFKLGKV